MTNIRRKHIGGQLIVADPRDSTERSRNHHTTCRLARTARRQLRIDNNALTGLTRRVILPRLAIVMTSPE
jgi:hypothetical protein